MEQFLQRWGYQFHSEAEAIEYISDHFDDTDCYVDLYHLRALELYSLELFYHSFCAQFGNPVLVENAHTTSSN